MARLREDFDTVIGRLQLGGYEWIAARRGLALSSDRHCPGRSSVSSNAPKVESCLQLLYAWINLRIPFNFLLAAEKDSAH